MSCFQNWDEALDLEPEQIKRRLNGEKIKNSCITTINTETRTASFVGSSGEIYITSLSDCSCMDYNVRRKPCKHMYRLADELGLSKPFPCVDTQAETEFVRDEIDKFRESFLAGRLSAVKYAKVIDALNSK